MNLAQVLLLSRLHDGNLVRLEGFGDESGLHARNWWFHYKHTSHRQLNNVTENLSYDVTAKYAKLPTVLDIWIKDPGILNNPPIQPSKKSVRLKPIKTSYWTVEGGYWWSKLEGFQKCFLRQWLCWCVDSCLGVHETRKPKDEHAWELDHLL